MTFELYDDDGALFFEPKSPKTSQKYLFDVPAELGRFFEKVLKNKGSARVREMALIVTKTMPTNK